MSKDLVAGALFLIASIVFYMLAAAFPVSALDTTVSAGAFPKMLAIAGGALSLLLIGSGVWKARAKPAVVADMPLEDEDEDEGGDLDKMRTHKRALGLLLILSAYVALVGSLGYIISVFLLIGAVAVYHGIKPSWQLVLLAALGALAFWGLFVQVLGVRLPSGILPF